MITLLSLKKSKIILDIMIKKYISIQNYNFTLEKHNENKLKALKKYKKKILLNDRC